MVFGYVALIALHVLLEYCLLRSSAAVATHKIVDHASVLIKQPSLAAVAFHIFLVIWIESPVDIVFVSLIGPT